jgi:hypothetical protein
MRRAAGAFAFALMLGAAAPALAAPSGQQPTATVGAGAANVGDRILVQGNGWPARTLVHLELCGNLAIDGSADCALTAAFDAGVGQGGSFSILLGVGRPPTNCPCVVWVTDASTVYEARVPITIAGIPVSDVKGQVALPDISKQLQVSGAKIRGHGSWTSWFGAGSRRVLIVSVKNVGSYPIHDAILSLTFGKGANPNGFVRAPSLGTLDPGVSKTYTTPVGVDAFSIGRYTLKGQVSAFGNPLVFRTGISARPWGLLVVALIAAQLLLLVVRNRLRRRLHAEEETVPTADSVSVGGAPAIVIEEPAEPFVDLAGPASTPEAEPEIVHAEVSNITDTAELARQATRLAAEATQLAAAAMAAAEAATHAARAAARGVAHETSTPLDEPFSPWQPTPNEVPAEWSGPPSGPRD